MSRWFCIPSSPLKIESGFRLKYWDFAKNGLTLTLVCTLMGYETPSSVLVRVYFWKVRSPSDLIRDFLSNLPLKSSLVFRYWYSKNTSLPDRKSIVVMMPPVKEWLSSKSDIFAFRLIPKPLSGSTTKEVFRLLAINWGTYRRGPVTLFTMLCFLKASSMLLPPVV